MEKQTALPKLEAGTDEEWVSALLDGELEDAESRRGLARIVREDGAACRWAEYCLIGDVMRGGAADSPRLDARIRAALAEEPTVLAPMPVSRSHVPPYYWVAAAAAVAAITWSVLSLAPAPHPAAPIVASNVAANTVAAGVQPEAANEVMPYLAAHQDYAYAVVSDPEMRFTQVSLVGAAQ